MKKHHIFRKVFLINMERCLSRIEELFMTTFMFITLGENCIKFKVSLIGSLMTNAIFSQLLLVNCVVSFLIRGAHTDHWNTEIPYKTNRIVEKPCRRVLAVKLVFKFQSKQHYLFWQQVAKISNVVVDLQKLCDKMFFKFFFIKLHLLIKK